MGDIAHSDFLIHWTGSDIEPDHSERFKEFRCGWMGMPEHHEYVKKYLERLKETLEHGLWMNTPNPKEPGETIDVNGKSFPKPRNVARISFTELRLSQCDKHAEKFGRLGIGVKRMFVVNRMGGPIHYVRNGQNSLFFPPYAKIFYDAKDHISKNKFAPELCSFFKSMTSGQAEKYDLFDESEWRIVYSDEIKTGLKDKPMIASLFCDPRDKSNSEANALFKKRPKDVQDRLKYLLPLDRWLAMIIYPNPVVKSAAYHDQDIRRLIENIKVMDRSSGAPGHEKMMPMEIDLPACRNF